MSIEMIERLKGLAAGQNGVPQIRIGRVTSVDAVKHAVKVMTYPNEILTGWLPAATIASGAVKIAIPPEVGSFVVLALQEGDPQSLIVIGCLFSKREMPPISPVTAQPVQPGEVGVFLPGGTYLHMTATGTYLGGDLHVSGDLYDKHGSLDRLRGNYNAHLHGGVAQGGTNTAGTNATDPE